MKKLSIILLAMALALAFALPLWSASTTDYLLQRANETHGEGVVTWGNTTPISVIMSSAVAETDGTNTFATTSEVVTLIGQASAVAGTQPMLVTTVINASATTAITGSITWSAGNLYTLEINGPSESAQSKTTDCSGITLTACVVAANALSFTDPAITVTVTAGASLPDSSYTDLYEPEAGTDLAESAFTVSANASSTTTPIAMGDGTLYDSNTLDISGLTLAALETTIEAIYGGSYIEVTIADGLPLGLANSSDSLADKGATDFEAANPLPFTANTPPLDRLVEDRYTSVGMCVYMADVGTLVDFEVWDGATRIWKQTAIDGGTTYTPVDFRDVLSRTGTNVLQIRLQTPDTMTAAEIFCLGRTD